MGLRIPPAPVVRVQPNYKDTYEMKVAPAVSPKLDKIRFANLSTSFGVDR